MSGERSGNMLSSERERFSRMPMGSGMTAPRNVTRRADARGAGECRIICIRVRTLTRQGPRGARRPHGSERVYRSPAGRPCPRRVDAMPARVVHTTMYGKECELTRTLTIKAYDKSNRNSQSHRT